MYDICQQCVCVCGLSDAPVISCPLVVDVQTHDVGKPANLSCDVESYPASTVRWRCCGMDRDVPDSVLYEKVPALKLLHFRWTLFASELRKAFVCITLIIMTADWTFILTCIARVSNPGPFFQSRDPGGIKGLAVVVVSSVKRRINGICFLTYLYKKT